ncbi:J domain-containing protein [Halomonas sp. hl-4]|uniref:J domain-containing protein n=1 Tax=unclassified Halomonas TaxID=2609666 RepID=UPI0007F16CED|nr:MULTISPECIES: J domain-containing protein [unclassified Halomonas]SBR47118.1 DnaJ domain-containing protein [Halomonas sp. HL-93]SNY99064.1 DnaJ domain-containing protein [Halomonas sp. hl-4]
MSMARFSPFELVLLKSRSQVDTATLLLLAWVLVHRQHVSEGQRRRRLAQVTAQFRHGHELGPVMGIAHSQDLQAIQLAAEILRKECSQERSLSILHQSIAVATDDGELSLANHYILRFLADLLNVSPTTLSTLFYELTGRQMGSPEDPSRHTYWQQHNPDYFSQKARDAAAEKQAREAAEQQAHRQAQQREQKKQRKQQEKQRQQEEAHARQEHTRQERDRQRKQDEQYRREQAQREKARQERTRHEGARGERRQWQRTAPPPDRTTRALAVLGLPPGASRGDVRLAYRRMAQLHHPDRFFTESDHQVALASARFQRIKNAYDYLMQTY